MNNLEKNLAEKILRLGVLMQIAQIGQQQAENSLRADEYRAGQEMGQLAGQCRRRIGILHGISRKTEMILHEESRN